jgi:hypothetical protein
MQQPGLKPSLPKSSSRRATSIAGQLSMFDLVTWADTNNVTFSLALADGVSLSVTPAGQTINLCGPEAAPASPFPLPASAKVSPTPATSGQSGENLSASDILQRSLESRLRARLHGSDLCEVIWKPWTTPWGQCLSKPRARVRTTFGTASGSWPTPTTRDHKDGSYCPNVPVNGLLGRMVWSTPRANEGTGAKIPPGRQGGMSLKAMAATWVTPTANEASRGNKPPRPHDTGIPLTQQVASIGSQAQTEKRGALNPEFVCWLMGFPAAWVSCGVSGMQSIPGRQRRSSGRPEKP